MQGKTNQFKLMKLIFIISFLLSVAACNSASDNTPSTDSNSNTVVPQAPVLNAENYAGTLPCADCEGIDVSLQLNNDSSYSMNSVYKGSRVDSANNHLKETGKWSMHGTDTLYLSDTNNHSIKYIKTDSTLTQLDGDGNIITGPLAAMFVLHKK